MVPYRFGKESYNVDYPNLTQYADLIDIVKNDNSFYEYYSVQRSQRPDNLSQELYGTPNYHWTFFLLNDHIREAGWPLDEYLLEKKIQTNHPNTVIQTTDDLIGHFLVGDKIKGFTSAQARTIIKRNLDLGQIFVEGTNPFVDGELITTVEVDNPTTITCLNALDEYLAAVYYTNVAGDEIIDIDPLSGPGSAVPITYDEYYRSRNDDLKQIRVIKPLAISRIVDEFERVMKNVSS